MAPWGEGSQSIAFSMWTVGSAAISVEEALRPSGLHGDGQLMVTIGVTNRSHLIGQFQISG